VLDVGVEHSVMINMVHVWSTHAIPSSSCYLTGGTAVSTPQVFLFFAFSFALHHSVNPASSTVRVP
jgi:hypothetical protein